MPDTARLVRIALSGIPETLYRHRPLVQPYTTEDAVPPGRTEPYGCRYCAVPELRHADRWSPSGGDHSWQPPTDNQVLTRMLIRRVWAHPHAYVLALEDVNALGYLPAADDWSVDSDVLHDHFARAAQELLDAGLLPQVAATLTPTGATP